MKIDANKGIDSIGYNYLNLPQYIHIKGKGTITYAYDATGLKEAKITTDSTLNPVKKTTIVYCKNFQYTNDTLTQASVADGRARWQLQYYLNGTSAWRFFFDYFLKDHLGDTRVVLTTEKDTSNYMATMEAAYRAKELSLFYNIDSTSYPAASVPGGYPTDNTTTPNDSVAMVEGNGHTQGPALLLKVMTGDSISIGVKSYYVSGGTAGSNTSSLNSVLNTLASGLISLGGGGGHGTLPNLDNTSGSPVYNALNSYFYPTYDSTPGSRPKAYLNWMLLDNQFNYVSGNNQSGAIPVGNANTLNTLATTIRLKHSGYLYIWVSNETQNWMVFFDNLSVQDFSGPMLEENHYYPFGLSMAGISDKALKQKYSENKYRYNGKELQHQEFNDGTGLEEYDYGARLQDPQLGRFWTIDRMSENFFPLSTYSYVANNPILVTDPTGNDWSISCNVDKEGVYHFHIQFNGVVVDETSDHKGQADKLANTIKSQFESLFNQDKSKDKKGFTVDATADIRTATSEKDAYWDETVFKIEDAKSNNLKYKGANGQDQYAAGKELNGKEIAISEDFVPDAIAGNANKTIPHEIGHLGGLHHPEDDGGVWGWLFNRPANGLERSTNNFMFAGGTYGKNADQLNKNPTGPTRDQLLHIYKLYKDNKLNSKNIDPVYQ